jgi:hypothetical protein
MKPFIRRITLYFVILLILAGGIISTLLKVYPEVFLSSRVEYVMWHKQLQRIQETKNNQQLNAIIGDSRAMAAINPVSLGPNYVNFSLGGTSFYEGYITLRTLLKTNKIDTLILCYAPIHFEKNGGNLLKRTMVFQHSELHDILELKLIEKKFHANIETEDAHDEQPSATIDRLLHYYHEPFTFRSTLVDQYHNNWKTPEIEAQVIKELNDNRGQVYFGRNISMHGVAEEAREQSFNPNPVILIYFDKLAQLVDKYKIKCYLITPPMSKNTYEFAKKHYFTNYISLLNTLQKKYPFMQINRELTVLSSFHFGDASHVNALGQVAYKFKVDSLMFKVVKH